MKETQALFLFFVFSLFCSCSHVEGPFVLDDSCYFSSVITSKQELRVLDIGNSYTNDATALLPFITSELSLDLSDICLYKAVRGGASFRDWYNIYNNLDNTSYNVKKVVGDLYANVKEGEGGPFDGSLFRSLLSDEVWDVIIIHQASIYSTAFDSWVWWDNDGYLTELLDIIKENQPNCILGFLLIHSFDNNYPKNQEHSSLLRWTNIAASALSFVTSYSIGLLIPYGTAIQNLRSTELNNGIELTRDGSHLGLGLAQYTAACCYYESLFAPRTGVSILGKNIQYHIIDNPAKSYYSVTTENMEIAQKAAVLACKYPFICLNPEDF